MEDILAGLFIVILLTVILAVVICLAIADAPEDWDD